MCGFSNVWVCACVGFVMCGCMCGFCNVWVCVCVGFVICGWVYVWGLSVDVRVELGGRGWMKKKMWGVVFCWFLNFLGGFRFGFGISWVCVCVGFVICGCVYVWVL
jgi:hypothetical protein